MNKTDESSEKISKNEISIFYFDLETTGFAHTQVEKSDLCRTSQTALHRASCKLQVMPVLTRRYLVNRRHSTGLVLVQY